MPEIVKPKTPTRRIENTRVKDSHSDHNHMVDGLSEDMQAFYGELTQLFPDVRLTSGKRDGDGDSHHHTGNAIDIGKEGNDVYYHLTSTVEGLQLMDKYKLGILDETDPEAMKKTGATGPHYHIGRDSGLYANTQKRYEQFDIIKPLYSFYNQNPDFDYTKVGSMTNEDISKYKADNSAGEVYFEGQGPNNMTSAFKLVLPTKDASVAFKQEIEKESEKQEIKDKKESESEARQMLKQQAMEEEQRMQNVIQTLSGIKARDEESLQREDLTEKYQIPEVPTSNIEIQSTLPQLPSLFNIQ
jgi:hypothetical protein